MISPRGRAGAPGSSAHGGSLPLASNPTTSPYSLPAPLLLHPQAMPLANSPKAHSPRIHRPGSPHDAPAPDGPRALPWVQRVRWQRKTQQPPGSAGRSALSGRESAIFPALLCLPSELTGRPHFPGFTGRWVTIRTNIKHSVLSRKQIPGAGTGSALRSVPSRLPLPEEEEASPWPPTQLPVLLAKGTLQRLQGAAPFKKGLPFNRTWRDEAPLS